jgi:hypothetical protein
MTLTLKSLFSPQWAIRLFVFTAAISLLACAPAAFSQKAAAEDGTLPKYDLHTETKTKGIVDEINRLPLGKKDITELILKSGDDKIHIYVCPQAFQDEMGITFTKGDEIAVTGSKVKQQTAEVILARQMTRGSDTLTFRDDKGNVIWNWRTGK